MLFKVSFSKGEMGCLNSTVKAEPLPDNLTIQETPKSPPETDHRLPLNARQVFRLKKNWKGIKRQLEVTGVEMFVRLVKTKFHFLFSKWCVKWKTCQIENILTSHDPTKCLLEYRQDPSNRVTLQCQQPGINEFSFAVCKNISFLPSVKWFWFPCQ